MFIYLIKWIGCFHVDYFLFAHSGYVIFNEAPTKGSKSQDKSQLEQWGQNYKMAPWFMTCSIFTLIVLTWCSTSSACKCWMLQRKRQSFWLHFLCIGRFLKMAGYLILKTPYSMLFIRLDLGERAKFQNCQTLWKSSILSRFQKLFQRLNILSPPKMKKALQKYASAYYLWIYVTLQDVQTILNTFSRISEFWPFLYHSGGSTKSIA